jgi:hypothetical protein
MPIAQMQVEGLALISNEPRARCRRAATVVMLTPG